MEILGLRFYTWKKNLKNKFKYSIDWWKGLAGKGDCHWAWLPEFKSIRWKARTYSCMLCSDLHICTIASACHAPPPKLHMPTWAWTHTINFYKILYVFWSVCYRAVSVQKVTCLITIITPTRITVYEAIINILVIRTWLCNLLKTVCRFYFQNRSCRVQAGLTLTL